MDDLTVAGYTQSIVLNHFLAKSPAEKKYFFFKYGKRSQLDFFIFFP